ncbi:uncharacterized protein [Macrobrachium rosenbergii]|uniref:uncharacterized protein n=1 Tax=Macrobrachium rosenbergii TaxID=79674 RepID=UPI0034D48DFE
MRFSVAVPRSKKPLATAALRKYSRLRRPGGLRREYKKLRSLLPGATRSRHLRKKVGVVEAAYQYICELQAALLDKFSTKGVPEDLAGIVRGKVATASDIQALALHLINNSPSMNNNNNNYNFMRSNYVNTTAPIHPSLLPRPTQQSDLRFTPINNNNKPESDAPSVPKTTTSPSPADTTMNSTVCSSPVPATTHNTVGLPEGCFPCDNNTHVPTGSDAYHPVDGEMPLLSKNISDISLSVREEPTEPSSSSSSFSSRDSSSSSSSSSALLLSSHPSPTIEK